MTSLNSPAARGRIAANNSVNSPNNLRTTNSASASDRPPRPYSSLSATAATSSSRVRGRSESKRDDPSLTAKLFSPSGARASLRPSADDGDHRPVTPTRSSYSTPAPTRGLSVPVFSPSIPAGPAPAQDAVAPVEAQVQALLTQKQRELAQTQANALNAEHETQALKEQQAVKRLKDDYSRTRGQLRQREELVHRYDGQVRQVSGLFSALKCAQSQFRIQNSNAYP